MMSVGRRSGRGSASIGRRAARPDTVLGFPCGVMARPERFAVGQIDNLTHRGDDVLQILGLQGCEAQRGAHVRTERVRAPVTGFSQSARPFCKSRRLQSNLGLNVATGFTADSVTA